MRLDHIFRSTRFSVVGLRNRWVLSLRKSPFFLVLPLAGMGIMWVLILQLYRFGQSQAAAIGGRDIGLYKMNFLTALAFGLAAFLVLTALTPRSDVISQGTVPTSPKIQTLSKYILPTVAATLLFVVIATALLFVAIEEHGPIIIGWILSIGSGLAASGLLISIGLAWTVRRVFRLSSTAILAYQIAASLLVVGILYEYIRGITHVEGVSILGVLGGFWEMGGISGSMIRSFALSALLVYLSVMVLKTIVIEPRDDYTPEVKHTLLPKNATVRIFVKLLVSYVRDVQNVASLVIPLGVLLLCGLGLFVAENLPGVYRTTYQQLAPTVVAYITLQSLLQQLSIYRANLKSRYAPAISVKAMFIATYLLPCIAASILYALVLALLRSIESVTATFATCSLQILFGLAAVLFIQIVSASKSTTTRSELTGAVLSAGIVTAFSTVADKMAANVPLYSALLVLAVGIGLSLNYLHERKELAE